MLFNSYPFLFLFLPLTLTLFFAIMHHGARRIGLLWLVIASIFFYSWWNPPYLLLLLGSILCNYTLGMVLGNRRTATIRSRVLVLGIVFNLTLLGYFKYANFLLETINTLLGTPFFLAPIQLPLAISFFTFQQIAYIVGVYRNEIREKDFLHYCLFVSFFPQLIAGPIVHHQEMLPQFVNRAKLSLSYQNVAVGGTIFCIGLFKKVVIADSVATFATPVFAEALQGITPTFLVAWQGALAYTFQIYYDFSGYSDMAIGLARLFGILLPLNFNSPYKSLDIIEFWRRWHMTLSRFLRNYVYIPLGGNRKGTSRRYTNLLLTMLIGGLWHGAGWTFIVWGGLHGIYLVLNHAWRYISQCYGYTLPQTVARLLTFLAVVVAWVFFRAESLPAALHMLAGMSGQQGSGIPADLNEMVAGLIASNGLLWIGVLPLVTWFLPNTQQFMQAYSPGIDPYPSDQRATEQLRLRWQPIHLWALVMAIMAFVSLSHMSNASEFLYFNF
jgi:D-alanyl-lipoteichoic acid acyltransferase DltB (MBOAT superfamily)